MPLNIVVADCSWGVIDEEKKHLPEDAIVTGYQCKTEEEVIEACKEADAILAEYAPLNAQVLKSLTKCKIISNTAIGYDNIDVESAKKLGIAVTNVPGYCAPEVADHTMGLILGSNRNIVRYDKDVRNNKWEFDGVPPMKRLKGQVLGLVGFGNIAQEVAVRAQGFGLKIIAFTPNKPQELGDAFNVEFVSMEELLNESDIISAHLPLTEKTVGFFDKTKFNQMKKRPLFVNTSRGKVVNEHDLIDALKNGGISAAALDVLEEEPPDFSSQIFQFENVIITPHAGFYSETALEEVRRRSALNVKNFFDKNYEKINFVY